MLISNPLPPENIPKEEGTLASKPPRSFWNKPLVLILVFIVAIFSIQSAPIYFGSKEVALDSCYVPTFLGRPVSYVNWCIKRVASWYKNPAICSYIESSSINDKCYNDVFSINGSRKDAEVICFDGINEWDQLPCVIKMGELTHSNRGCDGFTNPYSKNQCLELLLPKEVIEAKTREYNEYWQKRNSEHASSTATAVSAEPNYAPTGQGLSAQLEQEFNGQRDLQVGKVITLSGVSITLKKVIDQRCMNDLGCPNYLSIEVNVTAGTKNESEIIKFGQSKVFFGKYEINFLSINLPFSSVPIDQSKYVATVILRTQ